MKEYKEYSVTGMSCAACSARVESAVTGVEGVRGCAVSLLTNSMRVEGEFDSRAVLAAVKKAGYGASEKGAESAPPREEQEEKQERPWLRWSGSALLLMLLMLLSMGHMWGLSVPTWFNPMAQGLCQWMLSLAILQLQRRYFSSGLRSALHGAPNMDTLVAMGSGVSFLYSTALLFVMTSLPEAEQGKWLHGLYFESAAMIPVVVTFGKMLESKSKKKTASAIRALQDLAPKKARVLRGEKAIFIPLEEVRVGDTVVILPGESIPADGVVLEGEGAVDESALTGESVPADKAEGNRVYTGTVNLSGHLAVQVESVGKDTALSRIVERVTSAASSKAPVARMADRVAAVFVPSVLLLALVTLVVHLFLKQALGFALARAVSVLVISCPCALGLATPVAIMVASGVAARHGVLFKTAASFEEAGRMNAVMLDKTGTVTTGTMKVDGVYPAEGTTEQELLELAASLETFATHPIARAVMEFTEKKGILPEETEHFQNRSGYGVSAERNGVLLLGGKKELLGDRIPQEALIRAQNLASEGKTPLFFSAGEKFAGILSVSDTLKEDSAAAVAELKKMGLSVVMVTGDREETARSVAAQAGIDTVYAGVLPEEKEILVAEWQKKGKVMMVGDGINDAPALARADLGVAIGTGVEIAVDSAEVVLMRSTLSDLPSLIRLSRKTLKNVKENLFWAFCYNLVGIPLAAGVFIPWLGWELNPMFASVAMSFSSVCVVTNALRLNWFSWGETKNIKRKEEKEKKKMEKLLKVEGMMCPHCEAHVKKALEALEGVAEAAPDHKKGEVKVILTAEVSDQMLKETVEKEGYRVLD